MRVAMTIPETLNLEAYFDRIRYAGSRKAAPETLSALHGAHLASIPFENLDVLLGRRIRLDLGSLQAKLVDRRRGGYCFEQNSLFAAVLRHLGFRVTTLEARVRPPGATRPLPRTHMVLRVDLPDRAVLADVGFGGDGPLQPVDLDGEISEQGGSAYRAIEEGPAKVLQIRGHDGWRDLYAFTLDEALPIDFEVANHYTSTWPESPFVTTLTAQLSLSDERRILRGRTMTTRRNGRETVRDVDEFDLIPLLGETFGIELPRDSDLTLLRPVHRSSEP
jgi:N-hydroxyarylamine O-acetyltransferase